MNASDATAQRSIDRWFARYSADHRNDTNQWIHVFAVPAILWSVIALLWCIPLPPGGWFRPGIFAALGMVAAGSTPPGIHPRASSARSRGSAFRP
jgi:hypothetical protein